MVKVRHEGKLVDVLKKDCLSRSCFMLGFDKGTYVQGRGYTSYHKKERPVCMTRHLNGCPHHSICPQCRLLSVEQAGAACEHVGCGGVTEPWEERR